MKSEEKSTTDYETLGRLQNEQEVHVNLITEENEEAEEMREIDEGLLLELDAVGDFSVQEPRSPGEHIKSDEQFDNQTHVNISTDSLIQMETSESVPEHQLSGAAELQLVDDQPKSMESEVENEEVELVDQGHEPKESSSELHIVEAASVADIDLAFRQLHEGEYKKLSSLESIDDQPLSVIAEVGSTQLEIEEREYKKLASLESIDDQPSSVIAEVGSTQLELEERDLDLWEIDSALHVLEARSLEDIDSAFKHFHEGEVEKCMPLDSVDDEAEEVKVGSTKPLPNKNDLEVSEIHSDVHALEGRSLEDVNLGFKESLEEDLEKPIPLVSVDDEPKPVELEAGLAESVLCMEHLERTEIHSDVNILASGTLEDTDSAVKHHPHEVNSEQSINVNSEPVYAESSSDKNHSKPMESHSELLVLEAKSLEDADSAFNQVRDGEAERYLSLESVEEKPQYMESEAGAADSALEKKPSELTEIHSDLHVLEASSLVDIDSAFKRLQGGLEKSVSIEMVESEIESAESAPEKKVSDLIEIHSDAHIVEARSLEDIDLVFNKLHEGGLEKSLSLESADIKPKPLESEIVSAEFMRDKERLQPNDTLLDPQVLKTTSREYNDSTFKQPHEEDLEKSTSPESVHVGSSVKYDLELLEADSAMQVHETSSIEVIQSDSKQVSEGSDEDPPKPIESEDKPADFEAIERHLEPIILMRSIEEIEAALKQSAARESGASTEELCAAKSNKSVIETCDDSSSMPSASRERRKKDGSGKSSSSSGSSSSSSSSDSD